MENRPHGFAISKPQIILSPADANTALPAPAPSGPRPLSDIRELSEPSVVDNVFYRPGNIIQGSLSASRNSSLRGRGLPKHTGPTKAASSAKPLHNRTHSVEDVSSSYSSTPERSSFYSIPHSSVPRRSSSQTHAQRPSRTHLRKPSIRATPVPCQPKLEGFTVPNHGHSRSPVKEATSRLDAVHSSTSRRVPSRTYVRTPHPVDILEFPSYRHPRVKLELQVKAPRFVGGGSVEGHVKITVDENERVRSRRSLGIGAISVDLLGFEDMPGSRKATFLAIGTELIDTTHPPPSDMVEPANPLAPDDKFWTLTPSVSSLPFMISLPLDTGPPPFQSRIANIRFLLCATALIRDAGKHYRVRTSQDIYVLPTYDPEKALTSLPSPLTATDELPVRRFGRCESVRLTAGLHRQVWVSGSSIFVDVHIANKSHKPVKRLDLYIERDVLCYKHPPAGTKERSTSQARIFETNEQSMVARSNLKIDIEPNSSETRTCELELPRGHATVRCGQHFEVRFFLNVTASISNTKLVAVQLPISLIHINSLDVLPNSVAQVAAAIEEKRSQGYLKRMKLRQRSHSSPTTMAELSRQPSRNLQGRAFAAPREQFIDQQRAVQADIDNLGFALDSSPRKYQAQLHGAGLKKTGSNTSFRTVRRRSSGRQRVVRNDVENHLQNVDITPSKHRTQHHSEGLVKMGSVASMQGSGTSKPYNFTVVQHRIDPHTLGFAPTHARSGGMSELATRPGTSLSFREKMDRSRFEFKAVRRKASGSIKDRGANLWDHVRNRAKEREGWI